MNGVHKKPEDADLIDDLVDAAFAEMDAIHTGNTGKIGICRAKRLEAEGALHVVLEQLGQICCGVAFTSGQFEEYNAQVRVTSECAFCGEKGPRTPEAMEAHARGCEKHPLSKALKTNEQLRRALDATGWMDSGAAEEIEAILGEDDE